MSGNEMCQEQVSHLNVHRVCMVLCIRCTEKGLSRQDSLLQGRVLLAVDVMDELCSHCRRSRQAGVSLLGGLPSEQYHAETWQLDNPEGWLG